MLSLLMFLKGRGGEGWHRLWHWGLCGPRVQVRPSGSGCVLWGCSVMVMVMLVVPARVVRPGALVLCLARGAAPA